VFVTQTLPSGLYRKGGDFVKPYTNVII